MICCRSFVALLELGGFIIIEFLLRQYRQVAQGPLGNLPHPHRVGPSCFFPCDETSDCQIATSCQRRRSSSPTSVLLVVGLLSVRIAQGQQEVRALGCLFRLMTEELCMATASLSGQTRACSALHVPKVCVAGHWFDSKSRVNWLYVSSNFILKGGGGTHMMYFPWVWRCKRSEIGYIGYIPTVDFVVDAEFPGSCR